MPHIYAKHSFFIQTNLLNHRNRQEWLPVFSTPSVSLIVVCSAMAAFLHVQPSHWLIKNFACIGRVNEQHCGVLFLRNEPTTRPHDIFVDHKEKLIVGAFSKTKTKTTTFWNCRFFLYFACSIRSLRDGDGRVKQTNKRPWRRFWLITRLVVGGMV